jgi:hypothetical protein
MIEGQDLMTGGRVLLHICRAHTRGRRRRHAYASQIELFADAGATKQNKYRKHATIRCTKKGTDSTPALRAVPPYVTVSETLTYCTVRNVCRNEANIHGG